MKRTTTQSTHGGIGGAFLLILLGLTSTAAAQQVIGFSFGYEVFPYAKLVDPIAGSEGFAIEASSWSLGAAVPLRLAKGRIMALNSITYKRTDFRYRNLPAGGPGIDQVQSVQYSLFVIDSLSTKWKMVAAVMPGLASDFEAPLSSDDVTFGAFFGFVRRLSPTFQLGFGIAYMPDFGEPLPVPFSYVDWKIAPKLSASGLLPTNLTLAYELNHRIDLGLALKIDGNRYHGDPGKYGVSNPLMKYSEGTVSPSVQIHFAQWLHLNMEGGFAFYRNFEFFDGGNRAQSLDLKQTGYLRTILVLGR